MLRSLSLLSFFLLINYTQLTLTCQDFKLLREDALGNPHSHPAERSFIERAFCWLCAPTAFLPHTSQPPEDSDCLIRLSLGFNHISDPGIFCIFSTYPILHNSLKSFKNIYRSAGDRAKGLCVPSVHSAPICMPSPSWAFRTHLGAKPKATDFALLQLDQQQAGTGS